MRFTSYIFDYEAAQRRAISAAGREPTRDTALGDIKALAECWFVQSGMPYCKVYPRMADALSEVDLHQVRSDELEFPYTVFEVCLPGDCYTGSMLVGITGNGVERRVFTIIQDHSNRRVGISGFGLANGTSIAASMEMSKKSGDIDAGVIRRWRIAIGVALFMVNEHKLICPDLEPRMIRQRVGDSGKKKGKLKPRAAALTLGREIELPRPTIHTDNTSAEGRELKNSHVRRAHLAYRRCGEGHRDRRLVFIMPTIVRPDLPVSPSRRGYFIPDQSEVLV